MGIANVQITSGLYQSVLGDFRDDKELLWKHRGGFVHFIQQAIAEGYLDKTYGRQNYRLEKLSRAIDLSRDELLTDAELQAMQERLLVSESGKLLELPQYYFMRLAMRQARNDSNPTRTAVKIYERLSGADAEGALKANLFNSQHLLFDKTRPVSIVGHPSPVPESYYEHGWVVLDEVAGDQHEAMLVQENFIRSLDMTRLPFQGRFAPRIQLAKADQIPVCDDIVATSFQVLHFDMGHPLVESYQKQLFVSHVGIYLPKTTRQRVTARTRVVGIRGLLGHLETTPDAMEQRLISYVRKHGDGWEGHNTLRLACFIRLVDAVQKGKYELDRYVDKTVGQWFDNENKLEDAAAYSRERDFYLGHGINLDLCERQIELEPGQILILDNTRVIHGRIGRRRAGELFNYMWGIEDISGPDIRDLRRYLCEELAA